MSLHTLIFCFQNGNPNQLSPSESEQHKTAADSPDEKIKQYSEGIERSGKLSQSAEGGKAEKEEEEEDDALWVLHQEGDLETFTNRGSVVIVYFYKNSKDNNDWCGNAPSVHISIKIRNFIEFFSWVSSEMNTSLLFFLLIN